jgi:hypothetical protein
MNLKADPGGRFNSDLHRRVAGHLTAPDEELGYTAAALFHRMADDRASSVEGPAGVQEVLDELVQFGQVDEVEDGVFRLTESGLADLTGSIADEPGPVDDESETTPARLDKPTKLSASVRSGGQGA